MTLGSITGGNHHRRVGYSWSSGCTRVATDEEHAVPFKEREKLAGTGHPEKSIVNALPAGPVGSCCPGWVAIPLFVFALGSATARTVCKNAVGVLFRLNSPALFPYRYCRVINGEIGQLLRPAAALINSRIKSEYLSSSRSGCSFFASRQTKSPLSRRASLNHSAPRLDSMSGALADALSSGVAISGQGCSYQRRSRSVRRFPSGQPTWF